MAFATVATGSRDWRRLLQLRDRFEFSEEAFHLIMAAVVGVVGGSGQPCRFYYGIESAKWVFTTTSIPVNVVEEMDWVMRLLTRRSAGGGGTGHALGRQTSKAKGSTNLLKWWSRAMGGCRSGRGRGETAGVADEHRLGRVHRTRAASRKLSAMLASKWGQVRKWPPYRL